MTDYRERAEAALQRLGELRDLEGDTDEVATVYVVNLLVAVATAERAVWRERISRELNHYAENLDAQAEDGQPSVLFRVASEVRRLSKWLGEQP